MIKCLYLFPAAVLAIPGNEFILSAAPVQKYIHTSAIAPYVFV